MPFVNQQMSPLFPRVNASNLDQLLQDNLLCVFVFDANNKEQYGVGKWVKKFATF